MDGLPRGMERGQTNSGSIQENGRANECTAKVFPIHNSAVSTMAQFFNRLPGSVGIDLAPEPLARSFHESALFLAVPFPD